MKLFHFKIFQKISQNEFKQTRLKPIREFLIEYCDYSTIHGFRYLVDRKRHWVEKLWWVCAIIMAIWFTILLVRNVWILWRNAPVQMSMNEKLVPISIIPFPTVIISKNLEIKN